MSLCCCCRCRDKQDHLDNQPVAKVSGSKVKVEKKHHHHHHLKSDDTLGLQDRTTKPKEKEEPKDWEINADIDDYNKWQLYQHQNDRLSQVQHSHKELREPVYFPPPMANSRPKTSIELQRRLSKTSPESEATKSSFLQQTTAPSTQRGARRTSLFEQSQQAAPKDLRRESEVKQNLYELLHAPRP